MTHRDELLGSGTVAAVGAHGLTVVGALPGWATAEILATPEGDDPIVVGDRVRVVERRPVERGWGFVPRSGSYFATKESN